MRLGDSVKTIMNICLNCGAACDSASAVGEAGSVPPTSGDVTICLYCGHLMAFDDDLRFRQLTDDEMADIAGDERIVAVNRRAK